MSRVLAALVAAWPVPSASVPMAALQTYPVYSRTGYHGIEVKIPSLILGTETGTTGDVQARVTAAINAGYRGIDSANCWFFDEAATGRALQAVYARGAVQREDLYLASKFTHQGDQRRENGSSPYEFDVPLVDQVAQSVDSTLKKLGTDYLDALILHGQMGSPERMLDAWRAMEVQYELGRARTLGISHVDVGRLKFLLREAAIKPAIVQNRYTADNDFDEAVWGVTSDFENILYQAFGVVSSTHGGPTGGLLQHPDLVAGAHSHDVQPAQVLIKRAVLGGAAVVTTTSNDAHAAANLNIDGFELSDRELEAIRVLSYSHRVQTQKDPPVELTFWNDLEEPVNVFYRARNGDEHISFQLQKSSPDADMDKEARARAGSGGATAKTFHGHEYYFRSMWFGQALLNSWKANLASGRRQAVRISMDVEVAVINKMKSRVSLHLRTDDSDTDELAGVLDPHDDNPLNDAIAKVVAKDGDIIVVTSEAGEVVEEISIDTSKGGAHQQVVLRHRNLEL